MNNESSDSDLRDGTRHFTENSELSNDTLISRLKSDASRIDDQVARELSESLAHQLSELKVSRSSAESSNEQLSKASVFQFPVKLVSFALAASVAFLMLFNLSYFDMDRMQGSDQAQLASNNNPKAFVDSSKQGTSTFSKTEPLSSKHFQTEMDAIKADFEKLKSRIASL